MSEPIYVFDEEGSRFIVTNVSAMLEEMPDEGLEVIYKSTRYFHEFNKTVIELMKKGVIEQTEGEPYDVEGVERGIKAFADKISEKLGVDKLIQYNEETDAQWEANKPKSFELPPEDTENKDKKE